MKCFKIFLFILILSSSLLAREYKLLGQSREEVSVGDIIQLKLADKNASLEELKTYKSKRISELLYVLEVYESDGDIYFEAILSEKSKNEKVDIPDIFKVEKVNFKYKKIDLGKGFSTVDSNIFLEHSKTIYILLGILLLGVLIFLLRIVHRRTKLRKQLESERSQLALGLNPPSREHLENIYSNRKKIEQLYDFDENKFETFLKKINEIQYKKKWSGGEFETVSKCYLEFTQTLRVKNGI